MAKAMPGYPVQRAVRRKLLGISMDREKFFGPIIRRKEKLYFIGYGFVESIHIFGIVSFHEDIENQQRQSKEDNNNE